MHSLANLGPGDLNPFPTPAIRKIGFEEDGAQVTVAHLLINAWALQRPTPECNSPPVGDFTSWSKEVNKLTPEEREQLPRDPDTKTCLTPWREQVYYMWNHVFYDVGNWMASVYGTGSFQPPNIKAFAIEFPTRDNKDEDKTLSAMEKVWDAEALFTAAYLAPGIYLRLETLRPDRELEKPFHSADIKHDERYNVFYVEKGTKVRFHVDGEWDQSAGGLAAVIVHGTMLGEPRPVESDESDESDEAEEAEEAEGTGGAEGMDNADQ